MALIVLPVSPRAMHKPSNAEHAIDDQLARSASCGVGTLPCNVAKFNSKSYNGWIKSFGSDRKLSGTWPWITSKRALKPFVHKFGLTFRASAINSNSPFKPAPTIWREKNKFYFPEFWSMEIEEHFITCGMVMVICFSVTSPITLSASVSTSAGWHLVAWWHCIFLLFSKISKSDCDFDSDSMTMARMAENTANLDAFGSISMRWIFDNWSWLLTAQLRLRLRRRLRFPRPPVGDFLI